MKSLVEKDWGKGYWVTFLVCCLGAFAIYLPFLIIDKGLFQYCGDFNTQQIPFYTYMNGFVKSGAGQWSWETDLGSSVVNSYSFYLLGSPFFWLSVILPQAWVPFAMVPLLVLKFGVCGLGAFTWLRRYSRTKSYAVIAACLYAFSGFTVYNTFFNHFVDCVALFPFLLWALDAYVYDGQRAVFPLMVAINCLNNYFFFAGQIVFLMLYFFIKLISGEYRIKLSAFWRLAWESVLGVALGCILLIPTVLSLPQNPRTVDLSSGFGFLLYGKVQQYFAILTSMFLPPDPTYLPNIFTDAVIKHTSMTAYLPMVSMVGVWAYCKAKPQTALTRILAACLVMALVPVLNSSFYALNSSYYARWYYMPILLMCAATMHALENTEEIDIMRGMRFTGVITMLYIVFAIVPKEEKGIWSIGVVSNQPRFWLTYFTALLGLLLFAGFFFKMRGQRRLPAVLLCALLGFSWFYSVAHISLGKFPQWQRDSAYRQQYYNAAPNIQWPEDEFFRTDTFNESDGGVYDNMSLLMEKPSLRFFNSVVTPSIMDFYPRVGVKRDVSSKPSPDLYALRGLLGVRYVITSLAQKQEFADTYGGYGYEYSFSDDTFAYFYNTNELPMGFAYDKYILLQNDAQQLAAENGAVLQETVHNTDESTAEATLMGLAENLRSNMLVHAIALTPEQIETYGHLMEPVTMQETKDLNYSTYQADVAARRLTAVSDFTADHTGFTAHITLEKENLVFFSVPYDEGFTATVNGEEVTIERVSGGMSAVLCPAGTSEIVFTYVTPGWTAGVAVTAVAIVVWIGYAAYSVYEKQRRRKHA